MSFRDEARQDVLNWLEAEARYIRDTWGAERSAIEVELGVDGGTRYRRDVQSYLHRAQTLGLDNPFGRQALGKALATLMEFCVSTRLVYGPFPPGGMPSGMLSW